MKKFLVSVFTFYCLQVHAQTSQSSTHNPFPDSTGFGITDGTLISNQVGTTGGRIASDDGRVELIFPAGALAANTTISIQPMTNLYDSAAGKAYRFEPSGIQFKKPVQIIFHYNDEENERCPAELMSFAMQDDNGKWTSIEYDDWDSTAKTLKGYIHHFSNFTNVYALKLDPGYQLVMVNESTNVLVADRRLKLGSPGPGGEYSAATLYSGNRREWFANGVGGGNIHEGTIGDGINFTTGNQTILLGTYHAPWFFPRKNPVKISLAIRYFSKKLNQLVWKSIHCEIGIIDAYEVSVVHEATGRVGMGARIEDKASFLVQIFPKQSWTRKRIHIQNIQNYPPKVLEHGKNGPFREKIIVDDAVGSVDITTDIREESISKDYPPEVYFEFPWRKVLWHKAQYKAGAAATTEVISINAVALPVEVSFIANGLPQTYNVTTGLGAYKLIVKQWTKPK